MNAATPIPALDLLATASQRLASARHWPINT